MDANHSEQLVSLHPISELSDNEEDIEMKLFLHLENRVMKKLSKRMHDEFVRREASNTASQNVESPEGNHLFWNINAMSVLCWKGWDWPMKSTWNSETQRFEKVVIPLSGRSRSTIQYITEAHLLRYLLCIFPLFLVMLEVNTLAGLNDQGSVLKRMIYGDGYYYSPLWTYPSTREVRDRFRPALDANGTRIGTTARILTERPPSESEPCAGGLEPLAAVVAYAWSDDPARIEDAFWPLVDALRPNASWVFSHCFPWEYAALCAGLGRANAAHLAAPDRAARTTWAPPQCDLVDPNGHKLMSTPEWEALRATPEEIREADRTRLVPPRLDNSTEIIMWLIVRQVGEPLYSLSLALSLSLFPSLSPSLSLYFSVCLSLSLSLCLLSLSSFLSPLFSFYGVTLSFTPIPQPLLFFVSLSPPSLSICFLSLPSSPLSSPPLPYF
jgi:hypothetical protein